MTENEHLPSNHFLNDLAKPVQYNGGQCDIPMHLTLDWCELYCVYIKERKDLEKHNFDGFEYILEKFGTKNYANRYTIIWGGVVAGHILSHPRSTVLPPGAFSLRLVNEILYCYTIAQLKATIGEILRQIGAECINVTRLDIAIDAPRSCYNYDPRTLHHALQSGELRTKNRLTQLTAYDKKINNTFETVQVTIGSRTSDMVLKFYCKTLELSEKKKVHIQRVHEYLWGDSIENIYRLEVTLTGEMITTIRRGEKQAKDGYIVGKLLDADKIKDVFYNIVMQKYTLGCGEPSTRWDRLKKSHIINLDKVKFEKAAQDMDLRAIVAENSTTGYSDRLTAKNLTIRCLSGSGGPDEFSTLIKLLQYKPTREVFERRVFYWKLEAEQNVAPIADEYVGQFVRDVLSMVE